MNVRVERVGAVGYRVLIDERRTGLGVLLPAEAEQLRDQLTAALNQPDQPSDSARWAVEHGGGAYRSEEA